MDLRSALLSELKLTIANRKVGHVVHNNTKSTVRRNKKPIKPITHKRSKTSPVYDKETISNIKKSDITFSNNFFDHKIFNYKDLLQKTTRKVYLRDKYNCILKDDIDILKGIFNQIRNVFYSQPCIFDDTFVYGGLYVNYLPPKAHKTHKLYIINYRSRKDLDIIPDIMKILRAYEMHELAISDIEFE